MAYAELHCLTHYSFQRAASPPEALVERAFQLGYMALAITDECSVAGIVKAWQASKEHKIKLIYGSEFSCAEFGLFVLLAKSRLGYAQLSALITRCRRDAEKGSYHFRGAMLWESPLSDCIVLWRPVYETQAELSVCAKKLKAAYPNQHWLLYHRQLNARDAVNTRQLKIWSDTWQWPIVAAGGVLIHTPEQLPLLHVMQAIRAHCKVTELGSKRYANTEVSMRAIADLTQLFPKAWREASLYISAQCDFDLGTLRYEYPAEVVPQGFTPNAYLRQLGYQGLRWRYPEGPPDKVRSQLENELALVAELNYAHFFLTIYDLVVFARQQGILHQGRGSAANSVLCYCLGITAVNPAQSDLLFERFISRERNEPPDIDVDFEHERREEVIQYIYQKYGRERAALAATVITYRVRSALKDVGKALGFPEARIQQWINRLDRRDTEEDWRVQLQEMGLMNHPQGHHLLQLTEDILRFPRHLSQHVGGFVIAAGALSDLVPIENAAMSERTVIQWDKDDIEALCLLKVDVLALGMLTAIRKTLALLPHFYQMNHTLASIPQGDNKVYRMLQKADSVGVFQIESRAQMNMLPRLKPNCFYDLVIQIAIVRPGPIQGDMVHPYLRRREGKEPVTYPGPEVQAVLERTLGVPIFQEQVIKLAMVAAGFTGGEADGLRRAMASWRSKGKLLMFEDKLVRGMLARGYTRDFAERLFAQICGFGEYGFPESHAASFANLAYASSWLKYHCPAAFYVGLLNSYPMGFYTPSQLVQDARQHGIEILPICVNHSHWDHQLIARTGEPAIRLGFRLIKGLSQAEAEVLVQMRPAQGFVNIDALEACLAPQKMSRRAYECLASANAFAALAGHRYQTRWDMTKLESKKLDIKQLSFLAVAEDMRGDHRLSGPSELDDLCEDYSTLGLTLGRHPVALLEEMAELPSHRKACELNTLRPGQLVTIVGVVTNRQRPGTASGVTFITLEDDTGAMNVVLWQDLARKQRREWLKASLLCVKGILEMEADVIHIVAGDMRDLSARLPIARIKSRDFH